MGSFSSSRASGSSVNERAPTTRNPLSTFPDFLFSKTARAFPAKMTAVRQNFHKQVEAAINKQINMELFASYVYTSMWAYYERDDVALFGMAKFFKEESEEEKEYAQKLMKYQTSRGGRVVLSTINPPEYQEWAGAHKGLSEALALEKSQPVSPGHAQAGL